MTLALFNNKNQHNKFSSLIDEIFQDNSWKFPEIKFTTSNLPPVNITESDTETSFEMMLPGIMKSDIKVSIDDNIMTISHEKTDSKETQKENFVHKEFEQRAFSRSFKLPSNVSIEKIESKMNDGILTIKVPKNSDKTKKFIDIQ